MDEDIGTIQKNLPGISLDHSRVLVTGGAGFLGTWVCTCLIALGAEVVCLDNLSSGLRSNIAHLEKDPGFSFIRHDIAEPVHMGKKIDYVLHLASRASPLEFDQFPIEIIRANTLGTINALEVATTHGAKVLFTSTSEVYGRTAVFPTPETDNGNVNSIGLRGCYDESKRSGEAICMAYLREHGTDIRIARLFNTYGPFMRADGIYGRSIPRFVSQALAGEPITIFGDGSQTRSFCYVTDQIEGLLKLLVSDSAKGEVVNIGNDRETTILSLANLIREITRSDSELSFEPLPEDDPLRRVPDISKMNRILGWKPRVVLDAGIRKMIYS
jgi:UDP-glucuronate decarboxylase